MVTHQILALRIEVRALAGKHIQQNNTALKLLVEFPFLTPRNLP